MQHSWKVKRIHYTISLLTRMLSDRSVFNQKTASVLIEHSGTIIAPYCLGHLVQRLDNNTYLYHIGTLYWKLLLANFIGWFSLCSFVITLDSFHWRLALFQLQFNIITAKLVQTLQYTNQGSFLRELSLITYCRTVKTRIKEPNI